MSTQQMGWDQNKSKKKEPKNCKEKGAKTENKKKTKSSEFVGFSPSFCPVFPPTTENTKIVFIRAIRVQEKKLKKKTNATQGGCHLLGVIGADGAMWGSVGLGGAFGIMGSFFDVFFKGT